MEIKQALKSDFQTKKILELAGETPEAITRRFQMYRKYVSPEPKGYLSVSCITRMLAIADYQHPALEEDFINRCKMTIIEGFKKLPTIPWYWLAHDLAVDLAESDPPEAIPNQIVLPDSGIIVMPKQVLQTATGQISVVIYRIFRLEDYLRAGMLEYYHRDGEKIIWAALEDSLSIYGGSIGLLPEKTEFRIKKDNNIFIEDQKTETKETDKIFSVLISSLVYTAQIESIIVPSQSDRSSGVGFGSSNQKKSKNRYSKPLFIGEKYKSQIVRAANSNSGRGTSKRIHFRRGHWRRIAYGEGRTKREWRLFPPQLIGAKKTI